MKPKVSIIINNYNYGRFLTDAIESCLRQTYPVVETIVVDDGSTDHSREIIRQYEPHIRTLLKENGGQASCFNEGFKMSRGEILIFLDADDYLADDCVSEVVEAFNDETGIVKVHWPLMQVNAQGISTGKTVPGRKLSEGNLRDQVIQSGPAHSGGPPHSPPTSGNAWSKELIKEIFPIPEPMFRYGADDYLFILTPLLGEIKRINKPLGFYRIHGENDTLKPGYMDAFAERFENCCQILSEFLKQKGIPVDPATWPRDHWYHHLKKDLETVEAYIPEKETFILVDDDHWQTGDDLNGRQRLQLNSRDGQYWGPPANDADAISALENERAGRKANYVVFTWPAFWWLDHYKSLREHLDNHYPRLLSNDRLIIFELKNKNGHGK